MPEPEELYVIQIDWGNGFTSPPIGPFSSLNELRRTQTKIRKRLRANGQRWQGTVTASIVKHPHEIWGWDKLRDKPPR